MYDEKYLIERIRKGSEEAFTLIYRRYYKDLVLFGGTFLSDKATCEDIVQNVFTELWENRKTLIITTSLKSRLLKSVQNACIDEIRHRAVIREHEEYLLSLNSLEDEETDKYILHSDLQNHYQQAMDKIPAQYKDAFEMNRLDGLKYNEIADKLNISLRTVEVRISKTISLLRKYLKDFL
jgi:RNA polymerase sigma-70 factor (ECF subfamily)